MWIYIVIGAVVVLGSLAGIKVKKKTTFSVDPVRTPRDTSKKFFSRADIEKKLKKLATTPAPKKLNDIGAMCYEIAAPPKTAEYICPACGAKTLYTDYMAPFVQHDLLQCRAGSGRLKGVQATLDESSFCEKCAKEKGNPQLCLIIRYSDDNSEHRTCPVYPQDFVLLNEFLSDSLKHHGDYDEESPLKDHIDRIKTLLGFDIKKTK